MGIDSPPCLGRYPRPPENTRATAKAAVQAVETLQKSVTFEEKAKKVKDLKEVLGKWGYNKPL